jgi:hypothetical protein
MSGCLNKRLVAVFDAAVYKTRRQRPPAR